MDQTEKFSVGDHVVRIGTTAPVMEVLGKTLQGGRPYQPVNNTWTCFWADGEPHWEVINELHLEIYSE